MRQLSTSDLQDLLAAPTSQSRSSSVDFLDFPFVILIFVNANIHGSSSTASRWRLVQISQLKSPYVDLCAKVISRSEARLFAFYAFVGKYFLTLPFNAEVTPMSAFVGNDAGPSSVRMPNFRPLCQMGRNV